MPPRLCKGIPVVSQKPILPPIERFCDCFECSSSIATDRATGLPVQGRYITRAEHKNHRTRESKREIASARLGHQAIDLTAPEIILPIPTASFASPVHQQQQPSASPVSESLSSNSLLSPPLSQSGHVDRKSKCKSHTAREQYVASQLKSIQSTLKSVVVEDFKNRVSSNPLVFVHPPSASSPKLSRIPVSEDQQFTLDKLAAANSALLSHEEWLIETRKFTAQCRSSSTSRTRLLATVISNHAEKDIAGLSRLRREEWERQRIASVAAGDDAITTGNYSSRKNGSSR